MSLGRHRRDVCKGANAQIFLTRSGVARRTIKQCFFINHGDVFTHFLDMAKQELNRKKKRIVQERLQTQLDLALLRSTPASTQGQNNSDGFKDDLRIVFEDVTVADWLLKVVNQTGALVGPDETPVDMHDSGKRPGSADKPAKDAPEPIGEFARRQRASARLTFFLFHPPLQVGTSSTSTTRSSSRSRSSSRGNPSRTTR